MDKLRKPLRPTNLLVHKQRGKSPQVSTGSMKEGALLHTTLFHRWINPVEPVEKTSKKEGRKTAKNRSILQLQLQKQAGCKGKRQVNHA